LAVWLVSSMVSSRGSKSAAPAPAASLPPVATQPAASNRAVITALDVVRVQVWAKTPEGTYGDILLPPTPLAKDASVSFPKSGPVYIFASAQENIRINYAGQQFTPSAAPNNIRGALAIELP
jgi:hypothetical protein